MGPTIASVSIAVLLYQSNNSVIQFKNNVIVRPNGREGGDLGLGFKVSEVVGLNH